MTWARLHLPSSLLGALFGLATSVAVQADAAPPTLDPSTSKAAAAKGGQGADRIQLILQRSRAPGITTHTCPAKLQVAGPATGFASGALPLRRASTSPSQCSSFDDRAPQSERGGHCMTCTYDSGARLVRSAGPGNVCWAVPGTIDQIACEHVPTPPPSQSCRFELKKLTFDMFPLAHDYGDEDLWTDDGNPFTVNSLTKVKLKAALVRGEGADDDKLFLELSARMLESKPDFTAFRSTKRIRITGTHLQQGTAADIAACLAAYGKTRPFPELDGSASLVTAGFDKTTVSSFGGADELQISGECTPDSPGEDVDEVGCDPVTIEPVSVLIR